MTTPEIFGMIDPTITLGNIVEIGVIAVGGLWAFAKMSLGLSSLKAEVSTMQHELGKMNDILIQIAVQGTEIKNIRQDVRDLQAKNRSVPAV